VIKQKFKQQKLQEIVKKGKSNDFKVAQRVVENLDSDVVKNICRVGITIWQSASYSAAMEYKSKRF